ncbi:MULTISPECIES: HEPN domain-containing protein [Pseudomonas]|uniref:HEPN domain-containing protein n=1 Tax=Pseudomonas TaxID=286 RepID=UPI001FF17893|nr:HEPN domain-containing protein [Pseudomonas sp. YL2]
MHPQAAAAMKNQIKHWLESIVLPSETELGTGWNQPPEGLEAAVKKQKSEWLDSSSARALLLDTLNEIYPAILERKGGMLSERIDIAEASETVFNAIEGVPYDYRVFFEFDLGYSAQRFNMELANGTLFTTFDVVDVKSTLGWREAKEDKALFFSTLTQGYISPDRSLAKSEAATKAQGNVKNFVERALSMDVFRFKNKLDMWGSFKELRPLIYVHQHESENTVKKKFSIDLPQDLCALIKKITAGYTRQQSVRDYAIPLQSYLQIALTQIDAAKAIRSASEWRLDSLADPSPAMRLVKVCIGLESIFGDDDCTTGLTKSLSDRCAFVLADSHEARNRIINECKDLYTLRSKIVHGVKNRLDDTGEKLLEFGDAILKRAIHKESSFLPLVDKTLVKFTSDPVHLPSLSQQQDATA